MDSIWDTPSGHDPELDKQAVMLLSQIVFCNNLLKIQDQGEEYQETLRYKECLLAEYRAVQKKRGMINE